jgi:hypothetical protein
MLERMIKAPLFMVAPISLSPARLSPQRLASEHGLVQRAGAFDHVPSTGTFFVRPHRATCIPDMHIRQRHISPSAAMRRAVLGARPNSDLIAAEVSRTRFQLKN